jgi:hypothetical protein
VGAFPAYVTTVASVRFFARMGVSEVTSFFILMPLLTSGWFYLVGWLVDYYRFKRGVTG